MIADARDKLNGELVSRNLEYRARIRDLENDNARHQSAVLALTARVDAARKFWVRKPIWDVYDAKKFPFGHPFKLYNMIRTILGHGLYDYRAMATLWVPQSQEDLAKERCLYCHLAQYSDMLISLIEEQLKTFKL